ncbi:unnamed protein product [Merluccius merluccius]
MARGPSVELWGPRPDLNTSAVPTENLLAAVTRFAALLGRKPRGRKRPAADSAFASVVNGDRKDLKSDSPPPSPRRRTEAELSCSERRRNISLWSGE